MIARKNLPIEFTNWNSAWGAPYGKRSSFFRRVQRKFLPGIKPSVRSEARSRGPFAWQSNNSIRAFEYPWSYHAIRKQGNQLRVLEVGGGLAGLQFVLASEGDSVVNVDPGQNELGWKYEAELHRSLCAALKAPVQLFDNKIDALEAPPHSFDVILSVSALEHFPDPDLASLASAIRCLLKPEGVVIMTIDLFLDLKPFSEREQNEWGRNLNIKQFLKMAGLTLHDGNPAELLGFPEFNSVAIMGNLGGYLVGEGYPALSQCVVARRV